VRLHVDAEQCTGHGRCYTLAPELLESDDEGYVTIRGSAIEVPADLRDLAENIEGSCPEGAIAVLAD
jgi:ferredoxin